MNFKLLICLFFTLNVFSQSSELTFYKAKAEVNFREGPSTRFEVLNIINIDDTIQLLETTNTSWSKIKYKGETGYSSLRFFEKLNLKLKNEIENTTLVPSSNLDDDISTGNWTPWFLAGGILSLITFLIGRSQKNRDTAILLSLFFGFMGLQKFYLGKYIQGVFSLLFFWTAIPFLIGLWDMTSLTIKGNAEFKLKYRNNQSSNHKNSKKTNINVTSRNAKYKTSKETELPHVITKKYYSISNEHNSKNEYNNKTVYSKISNDSIEINKSETIKNKSDLKKSDGILNTSDEVIENYQSKIMDDSIIDIREETFDLRINDSNFESNYTPSDKNTPTVNTDTVKSVPYWKTHYVYSHDEIERANYAQKRFYQHFRNRLINGDWTDIDGNTNYAFILYFELLELYEKHQDIILLEKQLKLLGKCCFETRHYSLSTLLKLFHDRNDDYSRERLEILKDPQTRFELGFAGYDNFSERLGRKYSSKLNLSKKHEGWLNKFYNPSNVFNSIEGCCISIIHLFIDVLNTLERKLEIEGRNLNTEIEFLKDQNNRETSHDRNVFGLNYIEERVQEEVYLTLFKRTENSVREKFCHTRKISEEFPITYKNLNLQFEERIGGLFNEIINQKKCVIVGPDLTTQIALNSQNVNRWKSEFKQLFSHLERGEKNIFIQKIEELEISNQKNPNIENILFEASKVMAKYDKTIALEYYAKYINYDLNSNKIHNKKLTRNVQNSLFQNKEQLRDFEKIILNLIKNKSLEEAIHQIKEFYKLKRRKVVLNQNEIEEVKKKHATTVNLLTGYLEDENHKQELANTNETKKEGDISFTKGDTPDNSIFKKDLNLNVLQQTLIIRMAENSFIIKQKLVEKMALKNGQLKNQFVDTVNELCSEILEGEFLIEEDEEDYIMEESFYEVLIKKNM